MGRSHPHNENLPAGVQVSAEDVEAVRSIWEQGYAVLAWRLSNHLEELFPDQPDLLLCVDKHPSQHGLQHFYGIFRQALPAALFSRIPTGIELVRRGQDEVDKKLGRVKLRDHERPFPWCIGFHSLGQESGKLDEDYQDIVHILRTSGHDASWIEKNVVKPTRAQASTWRRLFSSWQREYGRPKVSLTVDVEALTARLDEESYSLPTRLSGLFLHQLLQAQGDWVSSTDMGKACSDLEGTRLDRLGIPAPIKKLIESKRGSGYRLRLDRQ